jgi:hypothetical protein
MPTPFDYEWGSLADPSITYDAYDPTSGQTFQDYMSGITSAGSVYDYYSFESDVDALSGYNQEELLDYMAAYGYEWLLGDDYNLPVGAQETFDELQTFIDEFSSQFTNLEAGYSPFPAFSSESYDHQAGIASAQEDAILESFNQDWLGQYDIMQQNLDALSTMHDLSNENMGKEYSRNMQKISNDQADYIRNQASASKGLSGAQGRSGLAGGSLARQEALLQKNISKTLRNINLQKQQAGQAYQMGLTDAADIYAENVSSMESSFYEDQEEAIFDLNQDLADIASEFEIMAGTMYENWYEDLIGAVGTFALTDPTITIGDWEYDWSPFGIDFDPETAANYIGPDPNFICGPTGEDECMNTTDGWGACPSGQYFSHYCNKCINEYSSASDPCD